MTEKLTKEEEKKVKELIKLLMDPNVYERWRAAWALGEMGEKAIEYEKTVPILVEALKDREDRVRAMAALALVEMGEKIMENKKTIPALTEALEDEDEGVRMNAAAALGGIEEKMVMNEKTLSLLINALNDKEKGVRGNIALVLGRMGEKAEKIIKPLTKALMKEKDKRTRFLIAISLARLEGAKKSEGIKVIQEMKEKGELNKWQEQRFEQLCQELAIEQELTDIKEEAKDTENEALVARIERIEQLMEKRFKRSKQEREAFWEEFESTREHLEGRLTKREIAISRERSNLIHERLDKMEKRVKGIEEFREELSDKYIEKKKIGKIIWIGWTVLTTIAAIVLGILEVIK
ncbi:MAG: hypothetical protein GF308_21845 [Candidatus Heimdallarchaeota archaeon]|nr:hypothetical protein [Candidatus Heimdallarchaeota archaeon]